VTGLWVSAAAVAGILAASGAAGYAAAAAVVPGWARGAERAAWGFALGLMLLAGMVPACLALGIRPGWIPFLAAAALFVTSSRLLLPLPPGEGRGEGIAVADSALLPPGEARGEGGGLVTVLLCGLILLGVLLYLLRSLTEPMWANDFLAIWGWKGKTIFLLSAVPSWMWDMPELGFTHPEYPLGLPFLYAGLASLLGRWDDHAAALLFPATQVATLLAAWGWLRRRGASSRIALASAAALALFEPLYRAFTTGMAEVPLSFFLLLLGAALSDAIDGEAGAGRRLALAALGAAGLKNEGIFAAAAAALLALAAIRAPWPRRLRVAAAALVPALAVLAAHRLRTGPLPLRDFRFSLLFEGDFLARLSLGLRTIFAERLLPAAPGILALGALVAAGRRDRAGDRLLLLAAALLAVYAALPAFCVLGPDWLARTAFARTAAALAPLAAAGLALRLRGVAAGSGLPMDPADPQQVPQRDDGVPRDRDAGIRRVEP
jgi:hypothetical protein